MWLLACAAALAAAVVSGAYVTCWANVVAGAIGYAAALIVGPCVYGGAIGLGTAWIVRRRWPGAFLGLTRSCSSLPRSASSARMWRASAVATLTPLGTRCARRVISIWRGVLAGKNSTTRRRSWVLKRGNVAERKRVGLLRRIPVQSKLASRAIQLQRPIRRLDVPSHCRQLLQEFPASLQALLQREREVVSQCLAV